MLQHYSRNYLRILPRETNAKRKARNPPLSRFNRWNTTWQKQKIQEKKMKKEYRVIAQTTKPKLGGPDHILDCDKTLTIEEIHDWLNGLSKTHGKTTKIQIAKLIN